MANLDKWLNLAVKRLSTESADTVRREIQEHYDAAREAALDSGIEAGRADLMALNALGDARAANREYRKVLLTSSEAAVLRSVLDWSRAIGSNNWLKWMLLSSSGALLWLSAIILTTHQYDLAQKVLAIGAMMAILFTAPFLPIYTRNRGRMYRAIKMVALICVVVALFGNNGWNLSWLNSCCICPVLYVEWKRMMIRRKLPIGQWPRQLYL